MSLHSIFLEGGEQPLVHVPIVPVSAESLPTFSIEDLSVSDSSPLRTIASGSATVDTLSEVTVGSVAGPRSPTPRRLSITDSEAQVGRTYRLTSAEDGTQELVTVEAVSSTSVTVRGRLSATYPVGSSLTGAELRAMFPADAAARAELQRDDRVLRVRWVYEVGGHLVPFVEQVRVVRDQSEIASWAASTDATLREGWAELVKVLGGGPESLRALVRLCTNDVLAELGVTYQDADALFLGLQGSELLLRRCIYRFGELGIVPAGRDKEAWCEQERRHYLALLKAITKGGGKGTAELDPSTDTATHNERPRRRYLTRTA